MAAPVTVTDIERSSFARGLLMAAPVTDIKRSSFGRGFVFGTASAAYQYEGAYKAEGKQPSNWDIFSHEYAKKIKDGSNGDVAVSQFHLFKEDTIRMKETGFDAYRFSISWARIMNYGKTDRGVNFKGIRHYKKFIDELISKGIQPYVTLFHFDVPQQLDEQYGGFLDRRIVSDFKEYAEVCFREFGDKVKHWITINEPYTFASNGYDLGKFAPGRCSSYISDCTSGNSATEPYIVTHNMLLAHAAAVNAYKEKFQVTQKGVIGITLSTYWFEPYSKLPEDVDAAQRAQDFMFGWYMDPITSGEYPKSMRLLVGNRLPTFTKHESDLVKGSLDFLGLNYYTAIYAASLDRNIDGILPCYRTTSHGLFPLKFRMQNNNVQPSYGTDSHVKLTSYKNGIPIGPHEAPDWMYVYPRGIRDLLVYVKFRYGNRPIYITENGVAQDYTKKLPLEAILNDNVRIDYHDQHLQFLLRAIKENAVDVRGYFAWSLLDNYEWSDGYTVGFGINYVDLKTMARKTKKSSAWFQKFLHN